MVGWVLLGPAPLAAATEPEPFAGLKPPVRGKLLKGLAQRRDRAKTLRGIERRSCNLAPAMGVSEARPSPRGSRWWYHLFLTLTADRGQGI